MSKLRQTDVLVLGGGSAGIAAAVSAARLGLKVTLLERYGFLGGMATAANVGTVCGAYLRSQSSARYAVAGFAREFCEALAARSRTEPVCYDEGLWFLPYDSVQFRLLADQLAERAHVELCLHSTIFSAEIRAERISRISALVWDRPTHFQASAVVDCTGEAVSASLLELPALAMNPSQASALVCELSGVPGSDEKLFQRLFLRETLRAVESGAVPESLTRISVVPGSLRSGRACLKLALAPTHVPNAEAIGGLERSGQKLLAELIEHVRSTSPELSSIGLVSISPQVGVRTGYRPRGKTVLRREDVLAGKKHPEKVAHGAWPVELWGEARKPLLEYFTEGERYDIPAGCLESEQIENLFFAGRNISADDHAVASARVIGTCLCTGAAAGALAAHQVLGHARAAAVSRIQELL